MSCLALQHYLQSGLVLRSIHSGLTLDVFRNYGLWKEAGSMLTIWSDLKPHLTKEQAKMIGATKDGFYVASENDGEWQLTKNQAMRRDGIDAGWNFVKELPVTGSGFKASYTQTKLCPMHNKRISADNIFLRASGAGVKI